MLTKTTTRNRADKNNVFTALFATQVKLRPDENAVRHGGHSLSYRELDLWSGRIASQLANRGVGPGSLVVLAADRGLAPIVGALAVLKVGAGYLGLDPATPARRQRRMIEETAPGCVLAEPGLDQFPTLDAPRVQLVAVSAGPALSEQTRDEADDASRVFHVVYTSGTTGAPKGVKISYRSVLNRLEWMWRAHPFPSGSVIAVQKSCSLVASPWEMLGGLLQGVPSVVLSREEVLDPVLFTDAVDRERITHLFLTPHLINGLLDEIERREGPAHQPVLISSSAEVLPVETVLRFRRWYPHTTLLNLYGMTETASNVAAYDTAALSPEAHRVPVGQPVAGASITVRDRLFRELPPGVTGEVWVSGEPLAIGYVNDDAAPAARFVRADDGTVHYRTGDRGRVLSTGDLEIVGRSDNQVKIRGYRVELEELEATLCKATSVTGAGACVTEQRGERQLMACVTAGDGADPTALRAFLRDRLPDYMVPVKVLVLPDLPLGANGKLDRSVLATLADNAVQDTRDGFAPADEVERTVADIWTQLLGAAPGTRTDNFFDVGGHSLLAVRLANRLERAFGYRITLRQILNSPTLSGIVKLCRDATKGGAA